MTTEALATALREITRPLAGTPSDFDHVISAGRAVRFVLMGEASHGTHEFYRIRAEITKRLIRERAFAACPSAARAGWSAS